MKKIELTVCDWQEIFHALDSKIGEIHRDKMPEDYPGQKAEWIEHLIRIQGKLGADATRMTRILKPPFCDCPRGHTVL